MRFTWQMPARAAMAAAAAAAMTAAPAGATVSGGTAGPPRGPAAAANGYLRSVVATSATNAWALGSTLQHWNGVRWERVTWPALAHSSRMASWSRIAATSRTNAWIAGIVGIGHHQVLTVTEHWNGVRWRQVPGPNPIIDPEAGGLATTSSRDAWLVGGETGPRRIMIEHWNGSQWRPVTSPRPGVAANLWAVAATSPRDAWAVGDYWTKTANLTLILHWNGSQWRQVPSPTPVGGPATNPTNPLFAVAASSPNNAWAVGVHVTDTSIQWPLLYHWNGARWRRTTSPDPTFGPRGVAIVSPTDVWAVGAGAKSDIERWNGTTWQAVPSPNGPRLSSVSAVSATDAWAVGEQDSLVHGHVMRRTVVEHWDGTAWRIVPSPSP